MNLSVARALTDDILQEYWPVSLWPDAPPYSGGISEWPLRYVEGLAVLRMEHAVFREWAMKKGNPRG